MFIWLSPCNASDCGYFDHAALKTWSTAELRRNNEAFYGLCRSLLAVGCTSDGQLEILFVTS